MFTSGFRPCLKNVAYLTNYLTTLSHVWSISEQTDGNIESNRNIFVLVEYFEQVIFNEEEWLFSRSVAFFSWSTAAVFMEGNFMNVLLIYFLIYSLGWSWVSNLFHRGSWFLEAWIADRKWNAPFLLFMNPKTTSNKNKEFEMLFSIRTQWRVQPTSFWGNFVNYRD